MAIPHFGVLLVRLLESRGADIGWLASASAVSEEELYSVVGGLMPTPDQLHGLARALGLRVADLCVMSGVPVLERDVPRETAAGSELARLIHIMVALPPDQRDRIHDLIMRELPQASYAADNSPPLRACDQRVGSFGEMLIIMLRDNRNLYSLDSVLWVLGALTHGTVALSHSDLRSIANGVMPLSPTLLTGFATVLGIPVRDLAAVVGGDLPGTGLGSDPLADEMAELLWTCRGLTVGQIGAVCETAEAMLVAVPADGSVDGWNRVFHHHGTWWGTPKESTSD